MKINVFWTKNKNTTKKQTLKPFAERIIEPGTSHTTVQCVTSRQLKIWIKVKLFNYFNVMGRTINKQSQICGPHFQQSRLFCTILICMDNYFWQFFIFIGVVFTA